MRNSILAWVTLILALNIGITSPPARAENCDIPLLSKSEIRTYTKKEFSHALSNSKGVLKSAAFRLMQKRLNQKVLQQCQDPKNCTPELLGQIVQKEILALDQRATEFGQKPKVLAGHAMIIGAMVTAGFASSYALGHLPNDIKWLSSLITPISAAVIWAMGATYLKKTQGYFEALGFRITTAGPSEKATAADQLDQVFNNMQTTYTAPQQSARGVMNAFMASVRTGLNAALVLLADGYSPRAQKIIASQLAEAMIFSSSIFQDVPTEDPVITNSIHLMVTDHIPNREDRISLLNATLEKVNEKKPDIVDQARITLAQWLKTEPSSTASLPQ